MIKKIEYVNNMTEQLAKILIGKHIVFTWHNKLEKTLETMPGTVLSLDGNKLIINTMDIFNMKGDNSDNGIVRECEINDITNIFEFNKHKEECWSLLDDIENFNKEFRITTVFGETELTRIISENSPLSITIIIDDEEYEYPLYFIEKIEPIN